MHQENRRPQRLAVTCSAAVAAADFAAFAVRSVLFNNREAKRKTIDRTRLRRQDPDPRNIQKKELVPWRGRIIKDPTLLRAASGNAVRRSTQLAQHTPETSFAAVFVSKKKGERDKTRLETNCVAGRNQSFL